MRKWIVSIVAMTAALGVTAGAVWSGSLPSAAQENSVEVNEKEFLPAEITVAPGGTVVWRNVGKAPHSAKSDDGSFDTGYIVPGSQAEVTFANPGDFTYYCEPHPGKKGVVHVR